MEGSLDERLRGLNLTKEENDKFAKAFKDPKFIQLFTEYAKEVSDPKVKEETDQYLRQLEAEGRGEEVYGKDVTLIVPEAGFVVKTMEPSTGQRAYINMCTSKKIDPLRLSPTTHVDGRRGQQVEIPLSLGPRKEGKDKEGGTCLVFDFVVAPATLDAAQANPGMMQTVVETAIENIECGYSVKLGPKFKQLKLKYKATPDVQTPHVLSVRGSKAGGKPPGLVPSPSDGIPALPPLPGLKDSKQQASLGGRSSFSFAPKQKPQTAPTDPTQAGYRHQGGEVTPVWSITHRGEVDLAQCWGDASRNLAMAPASYPQALIIRLQLAGVTSAAGVELDVSARSLCAVVPGRYKLEMTLPYPVKDEEGKAKFDKAKAVLEISLPTQPPPLPHQPFTEASDSDADVHAEEEQQAGVGRVPDEQQTSADKDGIEGGDADVEGYVLVQSPSKTMELRGGTGSSSSSSSPLMVDGSSSTAGNVKGPEPSQGSTVESSGQALTDNQRRWLELHSSQMQPDAAGQQAPDPPGGPLQPSAAGEEHGAASADLAFQPAPSFQGPRYGYVFQTGDQGLGYYPDACLQPQKPGSSSSSSSGQTCSAIAAQKAMAALQQAGVASPLDAGTAGANSTQEQGRDSRGKSSIPNLKPRLMSSLAHDLD